MKNDRDNKEKEQKTQSWSILSVVVVTWAISMFLNYGVLFLSTGPYYFPGLEYLSPALWVALTICGIVSLVRVKKRKLRGLVLSIVATAIGVLFVAQMIYFYYTEPVIQVF